jgi:positive phototaxis protein PixI
MFDSAARSLAPINREENINRSNLEQFLRFYLLPNTTMLLPVSQVSEAIKIPMGKIIPIAHMPPWVMGAYNGRGEILWTIDLGLLLGLTPWHKQIHKTSNYTAIVIRGNTYNSETQETIPTNLALVVNSVEDMEWYDPRELQTNVAQFVNPASAPFVLGYWLKADGEVRLCLEGEAILEAVR